MSKHPVIDNRPDAYGSLGEAAPDASEMAESQYEYMSGIEAIQTPVNMYLFRMLENKVDRIFRMLEDKL